jgi:RNA polymerase sigma factor (sigma-70 family)
MPHASARTVNDHLQALFGAGTCTGLTDGELVERFLARRDEGDERAFEALVTRHGPMVWRVCGTFLDHPDDVHDAFQAVFLVLARRAVGIRRTESVGSWLYGVTLRVAARARVTTTRRRVRDRRTVAAAGVLAAAGSGPPAAPTVERLDGSSVVHQELNRLPEKYRAPIVLCYLEGLTHDEAAVRLSWPVGTVRSRLSRARDTLRTRLARRGVTAPSILGPLAACIAGLDPGTAATAAAATGAATAMPPPLPMSLVRAAARLAAGQPATAGSVSVASLALAHGVCKAMMLKRVTFAACALVPLGIAAGGGTVLVRASGAQDAKPEAAPSQPAQSAKRPDTVQPADQPKPDAIDPKLQELLDAARQRLDAQRAFYEEGRITLDRFIDACARYERIQLLAAKTDAQRRSIRQRYVELLGEIERRETAEVQVGRGTLSDVTEARQRRLEAEFDLTAREKEAADTAAILRRLEELERQVDRLRRERGAIKTSHLDPDARQRD